MEPTIANAEIKTGRSVFSNSFCLCSMYTKLGTEGIEISRMPMEATTKISTILSEVRKYFGILGRYCPWLSTNFVNTLPGDFHNTFICDFFDGVVVEDQNYSENKANKQVQTGQD